MKSFNVRSLTALLLLSAVPFCAFSQVTSDTCIADADGNCVPPPPPNPYPVVYAVGGGLYNTGNPVAWTWRDGVADILAPTLPVPATTGLFVDGPASGSNSNAYVAGRMIVGNKAVATIWKNGVVNRQYPGVNNTAAKDVYVENGNVYVLGSEHVSPRIWKNGVLLSSALQGISSFYPDYENWSLSVSAGITYVSGRAVLSNGVKAASLWKNSVLQPLSNIESDATDMTISGSTAYISGTYLPTATNARRKAVYWKKILNSTAVAIPVVLGSDAENSSANSIYALNGDIYAVGTSLPDANTGSNYRATLWYNGSKIELTDGTYVANAYSVFVIGSDIYVGGCVLVENSTTGTFGVPTIWKNGVEIRYHFDLNPPNYSACIRSLAVK